MGSNFYCSCTFSLSSRFQRSLLISFCMFKALLPIEKSEEDRQTDSEQTFTSTMIITSFLDGIDEDEREKKENCQIQLR